MNMISIKEASAVSGIKQKSLYNFVDKGLLPAFKYGAGKRKIVRIKVSDLLNFIDAGKFSPSKKQS